MPVAVTFGNSSISETRITVPLTLASEVLYLDVSSFTITATTGSIDNSVVSISNVFKNTGDNNDKRKYIIFIDLPLNEKGTLTITPDGSFTTTTLARDTLSGTAATINFNTIVPQIDYYKPPDFLAPNVAYAFIFGFNEQVIDLGIDDFLYQGGNPGTPTLYRSTHTGSVATLPTFSTNDSTNWVLDSTGKTTVAAKYMALHFAALDSTTVSIEGEAITIEGEPVTIEAGDTPVMVPHQLSIYLKENAVAVAQ